MHASESVLRRFHTQLSMPVKSDRLGEPITSLNPWALRGSESGEHESEQVLVGKGAGQIYSYAFCVAHNDGSYLQQLEAYGVALRTGHGSFAKRLPYAVYQRICQPRLEQSKLVGPPVVAGSAVGEQLQLLLYAVLHVSALAVKPLVEKLTVVLSVGHYVAGIGSPGPCSSLPTTRRCFFQTMAPYFKLQK